MGVIIDEFEVILDSEQGQSSGQGESEPAASSAATQLKPVDINAIFEQHALRCERVRAH